MKILSAEFVTSAAAGGRADGIPRDGRVQIALAGRSNVGKSTLINALCRRKIARTSAAPGKTRLANIYRVTLDGGGGPGQWELYLVDLPGYGYARGGAESAQELAAVAESYFSSAAGGCSPAPVTTLLLVDSRHPGLAADVHAHQWLMRMGTRPLVIGTKVDKLSRAKRARNFTELKNVFGTAALPVSAATGEGLDDLWKLIAGLRRTQDSGHSHGHSHSRGHSHSHSRSRSRSHRRTQKNTEPGDSHPGHADKTEEKT